MDGEAGWWTTSGNIGLPPLARVMGVGRQQQHSINGNIQHFPHQPETPSNSHDIMSTMEQQHYRQQATMSTAHHKNGHYYGQRRASSNVVDQTVTQTARDYAYTQGHNVSSAPNIRYAPYHCDIYTAAPYILYTGYGNVSSQN